MQKKFIFIFLIYKLKSPQSTPEPHGNIFLSVLQWSADAPKDCSKDVWDDGDNDDHEDTEDEEGGQAALEVLPSEEDGHDQASEDKDTQLREVGKALI